MKLKRSTIIIILLLLLLSIFVECNFFLCLTLVAFIVIVDRCSLKFYENILFLLFLAAFFIFLVGGQVALDFFGYPMDFEYSPSEYNYLNISIFLSVLSLTAGYFISNKFTQKKEQRQHPDKLLVRTESFSQWALISFYMLAIPWYLALIEQIFVVQKGRYLDYYNYTSALPRVIVNTAELCPYALCFFLATFPNKKSTRVPFLLVLIYAVLSILAGRRTFFVVYILTILGYSLLRNQNSEEKWITRRGIFFIILLTPVVLVFLYSYRYIRYGKEIEAANYFDAFIGFFSQQGFTANLIPLGKRFEAELGNDFYSLYNTIKALRLSPISKYILGLDYHEHYYGSRLFMAQNSGSYARIISYLVMGNKYIYGYGYGSCYIAELLHDFGYLGLTLGNFLFGFVIRKLLVLSERSVLRNAIALTMFLKILMLPRYNFDYPLSPLYSISFWLYVFALLTVNLITVRNLNRRNRTETQGRQTI